MNDAVGGKKVKFRDSFVAITPTAHQLIAATETGNGTFITIITSSSTRR